MAKRAGVSKRRVSAVTAVSASNVPSMSLMEDLFGEEFPEAFATSSGHAQAPKKTILDLPAELLSIVCEHLSKLDIKRVRISSKYLAANVDLRIDRVYISPNKANLRTLQWVLQNPRYRSRVQEIVWDDVQLEEYPTPESFRQAIELDERKLTRDIEACLEEATRSNVDEIANYRALDRDDFFLDDGRLTDIAKGILLRYDDQFSRDVLARNAGMMSIEESYSIYLRIYQEEQDLIKRQIDVTALQRALDFPGLRKITLTSEVWRSWNLYPRYDTPFHRSLPPGFRKPSVWPWLGYRPQATPAQNARRDEIMSTTPIEQLSNEWRGYSIVVSALLALPDPKIEEFVVESGIGWSGISHQLFATPNKDLDQTVRMFRHVPLKSLQLAINPHGAERSSEAFLTSGLIQSALSELRHLEHLDLNPNRTQHWFDAGKVLPANLFAQLKTVALRNITIPALDLADLLKRLIKLQHVTLCNVSLITANTLSMDYKESWADFCYLLRDYYAAQTHDTSVSKPNFTWIESLDNNDIESVKCHLIDREIDAFLYGGGECPFEGLHVRGGIGWILSGVEGEELDLASGVLSEADEDEWRLGFEEMVMSDRGAN